MEQAEPPVLRVVDMGAGKGYLTFAVAALLGQKCQVIGVERREELVLRCNDVARTLGMPQLNFVQGSIAEAPLEAVDVVIALHACDIATDEALFRGIQAKAKLLVAAPCCQKELRPQLKPASVLEAPFRHGIFRERQAEFVTDALRAELLAWAGYRSKVFEFISTEHTAKNLMIAGIACGSASPAPSPVTPCAEGQGPGDGDAVSQAEPAAVEAPAPIMANTAQAEAIRAFAAFYGIRQQRLAELLAFELS